ncbi:MAG TPA: hypothetical protein V6C81_19075 [Planktothrix sp.]|jgi:hypothetical protein
MLRKYITAGLLGALLVFAGQFVWDLVDLRHFCWKTGPSAVFVRSEVAPLYADGPPFYLVFTPDGREFSSPYVSREDNKPVLPSVPESKEFRVSANQKLHWQQLWCQLMLLDWLQGRGATAGQSAMAAALLALLTVSAASARRSMST